VYLFVEKGLRIVILTISSILLARLLGPEKIGIISYSVTLSLFIGVIINFGFDSLITLDVSKHERRLWYYFVCRIFLAFVTIAILKLLLNLELIYLLFAGLSAMLTFEQFFVVKKKDLLLLTVSVPYYSITNAIKIYVAYAGSDLHIIVTISILENVIFGLLLLLISLKLSILPALVWPKIRVLNIILRKSLPYFLGSIAAMLYLRVDTLMLAKFSDFEEVGIYSAANRFLSVFLALIPILGSVFLRDIRNRNDHYKSYKNTLNLWMLISLFGAIVLSCTSSNIVELIYGSNFSAATRSLQVLAFCIPLIVLSNLSASYLAYLKMSRHALFRLILGGITNVVLNFIFIPVLGALGAAVASLLSFVASTLVYFLFFPETRMLIGYKKYYV